MTTDGSREPNELDWLISKIEIAWAARLLILVGFLTLSVLGGAALFAVTRPVYSSHMVLPLPPMVQALMYTDAILVPVARKIHPTVADVSEEVERLQSRLTVSELKRGTGLFSVSVKDYSPQGAQAILNQIFAEITVATTPSGSNLASAQRQIDSETRALAELKELLAALKERPSQSKGGNDGESGTRSLVALIADIAAREQRVWEYQKYLEGLKIEDVVVRPTLASRPDSTRLYRKLAVILLTSLLLPVAFVFMRDFWRRRSGSHNNTASTLQRVA